MKRQREKEDNMRIERVQPVYKSYLQKDKRKETIERVKEVKGFKEQMDALRGKKKRGK